MTITQCTCGVCGADYTSDADLNETIIHYPEQEAGDYTLADLRVLADGSGLAAIGGGAMVVCPACVKADARVQGDLEVPSRQTATVEDVPFACASCGRVHSNTVLERTGGKCPNGK